MTGLALNGADMRTTYGFHVQFPLQFPQARTQTPVIPIHGRAGGWPGTTTVTPAPLLVRGTISAASVTAREAFEVALLTALYEGEVTLDRTHSDATVRRAVGYLDGVPLVTPAHPGFVSVSSTVQFALLCPEPLWRATAQTTVTIVDATPVAFEAVSAPTPPVLTLTGGTNPSIVLKDAAATTQVTLAFGALAVGTDDLIVDCERGEIELDDGTVVRAIEELTSGVFPFRLLPAWGAGTVAFTSGTGNMVYAKRYW